MHVLQLSTFHEQCGIAAYTKSLADELARVGTRTTVFAPRLQEGDPGHDAQPPRLWRRNRATVAEAVDVLRAIRRLGPDVVHLQVNDGLYSLPFLATLAGGLAGSGIPLIATLHDRPRVGMRPWLKTLGTRLAFRGAWLVVHNRAHADELRGSRTVHVIPHGVGEVVRTDRAAVRARLGFRADDLVLAHFGFLFSDKGVREMLTALAALRARGAASHLRYRVCGAVPPGDEPRAHFHELLWTIERHGLEELVQLSDTFMSVADSLAELSAADWIVLNHQAGGVQGTSGAVRHALRSGRPVAVSDGRIFDDVRDAVHTLGTPLADALHDLTKEPTLGQRTAARGAVFCREHGWERIARRHLDLYESALRSQRGPDG